MFDLFFFLLLGFDFLFEIGLTWRLSQENFECLKKATGLKFEACDAHLACDDVCELCHQILSYFTVELVRASCIGECIS